MTNLRTPLSLLLMLGMLGACGGATYRHAKTAYSDRSNVASIAATRSQGIATEGAPASERIEMPSANPTQALVVEAFLDLRVDDVDAFARKLRERAKSMGGFVVRENSTGASLDFTHTLKIRIPPQKTDEMIDWTMGEAEVVSKRVEAEDVGKRLFDQELAISNLSKTMVRMQKILEREDLNIDAVLKIETELNRVRTQIETIKGENRYLKDRVSHASIEFTIARRDGVEDRPTTKFEIGVQMANLSLLDPGGRPTHRRGIGFLIGSDEERISYELQIFEKVNQNKRAFLATMGGAAFSDNLGGGRRRWLNPYLGLRMGYGRLDGSNFVVATELGIEIFKSKLVSAGVNARGTAFFGKGGPDLAIVSTAELRLSF